MPLGIFLPARERCEASEVGLEKFLPIRECYKLFRECCKASEVRRVLFLLTRKINITNCPASVARPQKSVSPGLYTPASVTKKQLIHECWKASEVRLVKFYPSARVTNCCLLKISSILPLILCVRPAMSAKQLAEAEIVFSYQKCAFRRSAESLSVVGRLC